MLTFPHRLLIAVLELLFALTRTCERLLTAFKLLQLAVERLGQQRAFVGGSPAQRTPGTPRFVRGSSADPSAGFDKFLGLTAACRALQDALTGPRTTDALAAAASAALGAMLGGAPEGPSQPYLRGKEDGLQLRLYQEARGHRVREVRCHDSSLT